MLRTVAAYTTLKQWEDNNNKLRKDENVAAFREEIRVKEKEDAIKAIAQLDGLISLFVVQKQVEDIQKQNHRSIVEVWGQLTKPIAAKDEKDFLQDLLKKQAIFKIFETNLVKLRSKELTASAVNAELYNMVSYLIKNKLNPKLNPKLSPAELEEKKALLQRLLCNEIFLICSLELYSQIDARQTASAWKLPFLMKRYLGTHGDELLTNPFIVMQHWAKLIFPEARTVALWDELAVWLEGLHARTYYQIPEHFRSNGVVEKEGKYYPLIEGFSKSKDESFRNRLNLTFYDMALLYLHIAESLRSVLAPASEVTPALPIEADPILTPAAIVLREAELTRTDETDTKGKGPAAVFDVSTSEGSVNSSDEREFLSSSHKITHEIVDKINENKKDEDVQFTAFAYYLKNYELNTSQIKLLQNFTDKIIAALDGYKNSPRKYYGFTLHLPFARSHAAAANEVINKIKSAEEDPASQIVTLIELWTKLRGDNSLDLMPVVSELINKAIKMIELGIEIENEELQPKVGDRRLSIRAA